MTPWVHLASRGVIAISGSERIDFLNGLSTQKITEHGGVFSAILLPNGRFFTDFFALNTKDTLLIDCAKEHHGALLNLLTPYAALHGVQLVDASNQFAICAALGTLAHTLCDPLVRDAARTPLSGQKKTHMRFYTDPRHCDLGLRAYVPHVLWNELPHPMMDPSPESVYHKTRIILGIPEGAYDLVHQQSIILEYGYHHMNALDWNKGCYMGQELMARTFHRGHIRKHLYRMILDSGTFPAKGRVLYQAGHSQDGELQGQRMGFMGGHHDRHGLATLHENLYDGAIMPLFLTTDDVTADPFSVVLEPCF